MQTSSSPPAVPNSEIDLRTILVTLWRRRWWVVVPTLVCTSVAIAYVLLASPIYRVEALVQIRHESRAGGGLNALAAEFSGLADFAALTGGTSGDRALALATLRSRLVVQEFIQEHNLLPILFESDWDADNNRWRINQTKAPTLWHGYKVFSEDILKVSEEKKTGLVTVAIEWRDPEAAAVWVHDLLARANTHLRDKAVLESESNLEYLRQQLRQTGLVELHQAVYSLIEAELKKLMFAKGGSEYALKTVDPAQAPKLRTRPKRGQIILMGVVLGGILGTLAVFIGEALRPQASAG